MADAKGSLPVLRYMEFVFVEDTIGEVCNVRACENNLR